MPTPAMKRMKKTEPPNEVAASGGGAAPPAPAAQDVAGDLYEDLPQLGHHDGQGQFQIGFVLSFVG